MIARRRLGVATASLALLATLVTAVGCGPSEAQRKADFLAQIQAKAAEDDDERLICTKPRAFKPMEALFLETGRFVRPGRFAGDVPEIDLLAEAGLLGPTESFVMGGGILARETEARPLTERGEAHLKLKNVFRGSGRLDALCWGERRIVAISSYTEPKESMGFVTSLVDFDHRVEPHDWMTEPLLALAGKGVAMEGRGRAFLVETNEGWRVDKLDWEVD